MSEDNNAFGQFGERNAKFDELLKKYQTINEGDTVASPKPASPAPVAESQAEETTVPQTEVMPEPVAESEAEKATKPIAENEEKIIHKPAEELQADVLPEPAEELQADVLPEPAEESQEEEITEPEESGFSYDIDIFSANGVSSTADIDSFDDSWIDSALDDSLFYRPVSVSEPEPIPEPITEPEENAEETESVPVTEYEQEYYTAEPVNYDPEAFIDPVQSEPEKDVMAGGYIAPSDFGDFEFDPESGIGFDEDDEPEQELEPKAVKPGKKTAREKKDSGKNEMSAVTGFSKNYKASEGKGSKKDGFFVRNFVPKSSDNGLEKARKIIMIVCVLTFIIAAVYMFSDFVVQPLITANRLEKLESMVGNGDKVADVKDLAEEFPDVEFPDGMLGKYAELYAKNSDLAGWINIEALDISLPVVQGEDNKKYLKIDFDGNRNKYGSVFVNSENDIKNLNYNTVLFGHHMLDSKMFGNLTLYKDAEYYKKAPVIEFNTIYGDYKWKIFAVFITNGTAEGDDGYIFDYTFTDLSSPEAVERFLGEIDQRSIYKPEVDISVSDKILTLSTCSYEFDEARLVVMARMVRPGESEEVSGVVRINDNPRYPAAYYEEKGLSNPYDSAYKWQPT